MNVDYCDSCGCMHLGACPEMIRKSTYDADLAAVIARAKKAEAERDEALALAYIGEHRFPDATWKARCEETAANLRALRAENERLRAVVEAARGAMPFVEKHLAGKLVQDLRAALAALDEATSERT